MQCSDWGSSYIVQTLILYEHICMNKLLLITEMPGSQMHTIEIARFPFNYGVFDMTCIFSLFLHHVCHKSMQAASQLIQQHNVYLFMRVWRRYYFAFQTGRVLPIVFHICVRNPFKVMINHECACQTGRWKKCSGAYFVLYSWCCLVDC